MSIPAHALNGPQLYHVRLRHIKRHLLIEQVLVPLARYVQQDLTILVLVLALVRGVTNGSAIDDLGNLVIPTSALFE